MDDFAHLFLGGENTLPQVQTYTFDDVVRTMNEVVPYDWRGFFTARILRIAERPPLDGLANSGWKLVYNDQPNQIAKLREQEEHGFDAISSIGLALDREGVVVDAIEGSAASRQGIGPGMKIVAVNSRRYSQELLQVALRESHEQQRGLELLVENTGFFRSVALDYHDGLRYPHLVRDESKPDLLTPIGSPKVTALPPPFTGE